MPVTNEIKGCFDCIFATKENDCRMYMFEYGTTLDIKKYSLSNKLKVNSPKECILNTHDYLIKKIK